ncbi:AAA+-type ATPase [Vanrija albida]|uniref:AAA+-type ATPase n=1 Tax=Vanrija albida TaxID=181172 RepID=A0ABR3QCZ7_9TREE
MSVLQPFALRGLARALRPQTSLRGLSTSAALLNRPVLRPAVAARAAPPAAGSFFAQSYLPFSASARASFFTPRAYATAPAPEAAPEPATAVDDVRVIPKSLPTWLLGCSALVFGIIVIGGLTRLTESGLSIVEWNPITGMRPPISDAEWDAEWEKYKLSPEGIMINANITREEFKFIFFMEWAHRLAGRALGVLFVVPAAYYVTRYKLPRGLPTTLLALAAGIGLQGVLGWYMVQSGLEQEIVENNAVPRVSQYRLAAHLAAALALYVGMVHTGFSLRRDQKLAAQARSGPAGLAAVEKLATALSSPAVKKYRAFIAVIGAMVFLTAVSGAFVAGLDAGLVYNEFPTMGGKLVPDTDELFDKRYAKAADKSDNWWRNMLENPVTAQFDHRVLAVTTFTFLVAQHLIARRPILRLGPNALPRSTQRWSAWTAAAALGQVTLGITTLLYLVPIPLAAAHQAGSVVLLTCLMGLAASMRRPGRALEAMRRALKQQQVPKSPPKA